MKKARFADLPLKSSKKDDICTRRIHFIAFPWMNGFLLHCIDLQTLEFHVEDLTEIHHNAFMNLLPQMGSENLNEGYFESWNLAMHKDAC